MKALCVADIHGDREAVDRLASSLVGQELDYIFLLGDYSRGFKDRDENRRDVIYVLESLQRFRVKAIPGNCDQKEILEILKNKDANLHETVLELDDAAIIGLGGSNPTPFNTPFELTEEEIHEKLKQMIESVKDKKTHLILLTHFPPKDTKCDEIPGGTHVGSESLKKIIEEYSPNLVVCSHIHESGGREDKVGETKIINVGRISDGRAFVLTVTDTVNMEPYTE
jgi:Icc-related predicted phosphoesterase